MQINALALQCGHYLRIDGELRQVIERSRRPSQRLQRINVKMKNIYNGNLIEYAFSANENVNIIEFVIKKMAFLSEQGEYYLFEDREDFSQQYISKEIVKDYVFLSEDMEVEVYFDGATPFKVELPVEIEGVVAQAETYLMTGTVSQHARKLVVLANGVEVSAPLSIAVGDRIVVNRLIGDFIKKIV